MQRGQDPSRGGCECGGEGNGDGFGYVIERGNLADEGWCGGISFQMRCCRWGRLGR